LNKLQEFISTWLNDYLEKSTLKGFVIGVSGGIDSALTSILCAETGKKVILLNLPIRQTNAEYDRAQLHIANLKSRYSNVESFVINLSEILAVFEKTLPIHTEENNLAMANSRARLRMTTLYAIAQANSCLVVGTGNKIEDFGLGFYTKYGDGGVDISPIADLNKSQVFSLAKILKVIPDILNAKPTDGLWDDGRSDEDQIGATYEELEWAMGFSGDLDKISTREKEVVKIYKQFNQSNLHKMIPIPVCKIPIELISSLEI
jgi:NAD+ synthase